jgi:hypothetical protein
MKIKMKANSTKIQNEREKETTKPANAAKATPQSNNLCICFIGKRLNITEKNIVALNKD